MKQKTRLLLVMGGILTVSVLGELSARRIVRRLARIQKLESPDGRHTAELARIDGIDRNYTIRLNGQIIWQSADFVPHPSIPFRETLRWDVSGTRLLFEAAGHRVFGYDLAGSRPLTHAEILATTLPPEPALWELSSETDWPGHGRTPVPR